MALKPSCMFRETHDQDRLIPASERTRLRAWRIGAWIPAGSLVLAATFGGYTWPVGDRSVAVERVRIAEVERGTLARNLAADGRVTTSNSSTLYASAAGTVHLDVTAGDSVSRDQRLGLVASPELESRLAQDRASLALLEVEVDRSELVREQGKAEAQKLIDQAEIDRQTAVRELEGTRAAYEAGALPQIDLLRAEDSLKKAEILLGHARKDAKLLQRGLVFELQTKRLALDRQRTVVSELSRQVDALVIRSPVDGQVGQVFVAERAAVVANAPVLTVVDLSAFELEINVPDSLARDLAVGMPAEIIAADETYPGRVRSVSPEVVGGEVASRLQFVGRRPLGLRQNQRLVARVLIDEKVDVLMVERGPFFEAGGGTIAYVVEHGVAERRAIQTGIASLESVEILSGVEVGDRIVISGADVFGDAERVRIARD